MFFFNSDFFFNLWFSKRANVFIELFLADVWAIRSVFNPLSVSKVYLSICLTYVCLLSIYLSKSDVY